MLQCDTGERPHNQLVFFRRTPFAFRRCPRDRLNGHLLIAYVAEARGAAARLVAAVEERNDDISRQLIR